MALWAAAIIGGAKVGSALLQKPKEYKPDLKRYDNFINRRREEIRSRRIETQSGLKTSRAISEMSDEARRFGEIQDYLHGTAGSGVSEQRNLEITKSGQKAAGTAATDAAIAQEQANMQIKAEIDQVKLARESEAEAARERYRIQKDQWKKAVLGSLIEAGAGVALAGVEAGAQTKAAGEVAKAGYEVYQSEAGQHGLETMSFDEYQSLSADPEARDRIATNKLNQALTSKHEESIDQFNREVASFLGDGALDKYEEYREQFDDPKMAMNLTEGWMDSTGRKTDAAFAGALEKIAFDMTIANKIDVDDAKELIREYVAEEEWTEKQGLAAWRMLVPEEKKSEVTQIRFGEQGQKIYTKGEDVTRVDWTPAQTAEKRAAKEATAKAKAFSEFQARFETLKNIGGDEEIAEKIENFLYEGDVKQHHELVDLIKDWSNSIPESSLRNPTALDRLATVMARGREEQEAVKAELTNLGAANARIRIQNMLIDRLKVLGSGTSGIVNPEDMASSF